MVFKGRFFSSKKSDSSSPDGSNSPRTPTRDSPSRSEKKKVKPSKDDASPSDGGTARQTIISDAVRRQQEQQAKKKDKGPKGKEPTGSLTAPAKLGGAASVTAARNRLAAAEGELVTGSGISPSGSGAFAPILASTLGLNRIKTRSGPLPMEGSGAGGSLRGDHRGSNLGPSNFSRGPPEGNSSATTSSSSTSSFGPASRAVGGKSAVKKKVAGGPDKVTNTVSSSRWASEGEASRPKNFSSAAGGQVGNILANADSPAAGMGTCNLVENQEVLKNFDASSPATESSYHDCETPKESESPRFKAIMLDTSAPRKRNPADIKSFSHELNSKGVRPYPFWKPRGINNLKEVLKIIQMKFEKAKEEVNSDLAVFAGELVGVMEKSAENHPEWKEILEDLLLLARSCVITSPGDFWLQCEGIVQDLDDRRQELPMGVLKKLHTRMLFILTRCTRLLQFHKESVFAEDEITLDIRAAKIKQFSEKKTPSMKARDEKSGKVKKGSTETGSSRKSYSQEQHILSWRRSHEIKPATFFLPADLSSNNDISPGRERISSWKVLPPRQAVKKEDIQMKDEPSGIKDDLLETPKGFEADHTDIPECNLPKDDHPSFLSKHQHKGSWGYWGDQQNYSDDTSIMCRICEEYVPTSHVEEHLKVCTVVDRCDQKGLSVDERLIRIAETLEKLAELCSPVETQQSSSPDPVKVNSALTEVSDNLSPKLSDCSRPGSADMLDCDQEVDNSIFLDDLKAFSSMTCKTRFGPKSDQGMATSSAGSMTPRSPLVTPRTCHIESILNGKGVFSESADFHQIIELADIARCVANTPIDEESSLQYLVSCLEDLQEVVERRKFEALTIQTFGARIEKLHREKYLQLCDSVNIEKTDASCTAFDEEDDVVRSLRTSPVHPSVRDRTSIDDFEIIKPISRGAFGRVFLAKKRTTGDLFAIKVLKKADMIRKNAVESILAERDILISVRNPFVVRFFYSFTSRENLYLVMEYLNGGDLYSLLRNLGCLDEEVARIYMAEVVLALEYLHSLRVVHRDLKPDNLLIAHDGHIKLTDFGLSKVGLINSTDDLSGPAVSETSLMGEDEPQLSITEHQRERHKKRSAVGTPDYLAPEILLGTGHGATADWWSVGVILFELIVGIPPFNAEHPQTIFDNILNRKIPWPAVPEEMSFGARDLIDKLMTEDPNQRLGAKGASEVKQHVFFKDINWDTLARQKAAFVPSSDSAIDTSYFTSRYSWNPSDERIHEASEFEDSSDDDSMSGSSSCISNHHEPDECECSNELESASAVNYSFSNFSFKNLSQLASINYDLLSKGWKDDSPNS